MPLPSPLRPPKTAAKLNQPACFSLLSSITPEYRPATLECGTRRACPALPDKLQFRFPVGHDFYRTQDQTTGTVKAGCDLTAEMNLRTPKTLRVIKRSRMAASAITICCRRPSQRLRALNRVSKLLRFLRSARSLRLRPALFAHWTAPGKLPVATPLCGCSFMFLYVFYFRESFAPHSFSQPGKFHLSGNRLHCSGFTGSIRHPAGSPSSRNTQLPAAF